MAGGLGWALAGAMAGAGKGMAQSGELAAEQRRQEALERLRHENGVALENQRSANNKDEYTHQRTEDNWYDAKKTERETSSNIVIAKAEGEIASDRDARKHGYDKELRGIDFNNDVKLKQVASQLGIQEDAIKRQRDSGEIQSIEEDGSGRFTIFYKNGTTRQTNVTTPVDASSDGTVLGTMRSGSGPVASTKPAATPAPAKPKDTQGRTYSPTQLKEFAQQRGISEAAARQLLGELGFRATK